jgi:hypothetical protein
MGKEELIELAKDLGVEVVGTTMTDMRREIEAVIAAKAREHNRVYADPFLRLLRAAELEHVKQISDLKQKCDAFRQRLDAMVTATWSFKNDADAVKGLAHHGQLGEVSLVYSPRSGATGGPNNQRKKLDHDVLWQVGRDEDDMGKNQIYDIRPTWVESQKTRRFTHWTNNPAPVCSRDSMRFVTTHVLIDDDTRIGRWITLPTSPQRLVWDVSSMALLLYDFLFIPLSFFGLGENWLISAMDWVTMLFWTCDMVLSLFTGYVDRGATVMDPKKIAKHYLMSWFPLDVCAVGPDWAILFIGMMSDASHTSAGGSGRLLRVVRVFRTIRLLRATKMKRVLRRLNDQIETDVVFLMFRVVQLFVAVVFCNHLGAGMWYLIGDPGASEGSNTWIKAANLEGRGLVYCYLVSLNWSLSNFGLSNTTIFPQNSSEVFFAIVVLVVGMSGFTVLTSLVTTWMVKLELSKDEREKQQWLLRRFFRQKHVHRDLGFRVLRCIEYKVANLESEVQQENLSILNVLPQTLRNELAFAVDLSVINGHPLFDMAEKKAGAFFYNLASKVFVLQDYASDDTLFRTGMHPLRMYYLAKGGLKYTHRSAETSDVFPGDWLCEQTLWIMGWTCCGTVTVASDAQVLQIDADLLEERMIAEESILVPLLSTYANAFTAWLCTQNLNNRTDLFDTRAVGKAEKFVGEAMKKHGWHDHHQRHTTER